ncbi:MAG TPA: pilus assembly protein TadG-related protein [Acidimicrobiia bacterium]|nr:pilus assembly protein TadG-related protein [Acidimicrobiia bacterium]
MKRDEGSITLWMVGLVMVVFAVGGISIDLWRGLAAHRHVASVADAAAVAAGSGIDETTWRLEGRLILEPAHVAERVAAAVAAQSGEGIVDYRVTTVPDGSRATVTASTQVELTLLALLADGPIEVSAHASASPTLSP